MPYKNLGTDENFRQGGPDNVMFLVINIFHRGSYKPPSRSNWTQGVQLLFEEGPR